MWLCDAVPTVARTMAMERHARTMSGICRQTDYERSHPLDQNSVAVGIYDVADITQTKRSVNKQLASEATHATDTYLRSGALGNCCRPTGVSDNNKNARISGAQLYG